MLRRYEAQLARVRRLLLQARRCLASVGDCAGVVLQLLLGNYAGMAARVLQVVVYVARR